MTTENELKLKKILAYHKARKMITNKEYKKELALIKQIKDDRTKRKGM